MRMRGWGVLLVFWLGALILGSQAFAASQTVRQKQAAQRKAARSLVLAEAARLREGGVQALADSTRRVVEADGERLQLEVVRLAPDAEGQAVRLRVLAPTGRLLQEHGLWISAPEMASAGAPHPTGRLDGAASASGTSVAGGSASLSLTASRRAAGEEAAVPTSMVPSDPRTIR